MSSDSPIHVASIPDSLRSYDQWVCWETITRDGTPTKRPIAPTTGAAASTTDSDTWSSLEDARSHLQTADVDGIGFVFTTDDPFVGIDLDKCRERNTESVAPWASRIITQLNSYTERSPSGTGFHVLLEGSLPGDRNRTGDVEMYETARYFTVTGDHLSTTPRTIERRPKSLIDCYREFLDPSSTESTDGQTSPESSTDRETDTFSSSVGGVDLDDQQLLEKARTASNGDDFAALWQGSIAGYESHSEADMALACHLAFWTAGNAAHMDALFRQSDLMREKWDDQHYADGSTYGEKTIERACTTVTECYEPTQTSTTAAPTVDALVAGIEMDHNGPSETETTSTTTAVDTADPDARDTSAELPSPADLNYTVAEPDDLAILIAEQQATIDDLQHTIEEVQVAVATLQTRLETHLHAATEADRENTTR